MFMKRRFQSCICLILSFILLMIAKPVLADYNNIFPPIETEGNQYLPSSEFNLDLAVKSTYVSGDSYRSEPDCKKSLMEYGFQDVQLIQDIPTSTQAVVGWKQVVIKGKKTYIFAIGFRGTNKGSTPEGINEFITDIKTDINAGMEFTQINSDVNSWPIPITHTGFTLAEQAFVKKESKIIFPTLPFDSAKKFSDVILLSKIK